MRIPHELVVQTQYTSNKTNTCFLCVLKTRLKRTQQEIEITDVKFIQFTDVDETFMFKEHLTPAMKNMFKIYNGDKDDMLQR